MMASSAYTPVDSLAGLVTSLQALPQHTIPLEARRDVLQTLKAALINHADVYREAEFKDLRRPGKFHDQIRMGCVKTCDYYLENMDNLVADRDVGNPPAPAPGSRAKRSRVRYESRGVVLVIGTWNFPLPLSLKPLATAIAAGCPVVLKLNEVCTHTSEALLRTLSADLPDKYVKIVYGGREHTEALLKHKYGLIFFTGGTSIGKSIYRAAAETLSPVCLELGGKNPVFITKSANLKTAVLKLVDTKCQNVGQFCVSPDHVLLDKQIDIQEFKTLLKDAVRQFFGDDVKRSPNYSRIVNGHHFRRVLGMADPADHGGESLLSEDVIGTADEADLFMPPTFVLNPKDTSRLLTEEIFGPVVPITQYESLDAAIAVENAKPHPLALYVFSSEEHEIAHIVGHTRSGGVCVNDCITHMLAENLPFGGIGDSGFGNYRGEWGYRTFTHERAVMEFTAEDFNAMRIPTPQ